MRVRHLFARRKSHMNLILLLFPFVVIGMSMLGFILGIPITQAHFVLFLALTCGVGILDVKKESRKKAMVRFGLVLTTSIVLAALPVMYTVTDGASCHRPAVFLLSNGWNPIYQAEHAQMLDVANRYFDTSTFHFRDQHVMWMPRGAWIFGAVLYKTFGFVEILDSLNIYLLLCSILIAYNYFHRFTVFSNSLCLGFAMLLALSPHVVGSVFGGLCDAAVYASLACGLLSLDAYRREKDKEDLAIAIISLPLASCIKFTGLALAIVSPLIYALMMPKCRKAWLAFVSVLILIFALNTSPFITSWVNHGGPFYPAHSFRTGEKLPDSMTFDFDYKNADAEKMGYWGRFCYAYVSKALTKVYYKAKLHQAEFNPQLLLFSEIDGFGSTHRLLFVLSLIALFWVKDSGIRILALLLTVSLFLQPGKYMGYSRYVAPVYMVPPLVLAGLMMRFPDNKKLGSVAFLSVLIAYALPQMPRQMLCYPYMWLMSVQNLQVIAASYKDPRPVIQTSSYYAAAAWAFDNRKGVKITEEKPVSNGCMVYGPCSGRYGYVTTRAIPEFRDYAFVQVMDTSAIVDKSFSGKRRAGIEKYFLKEFLPKELPLLPMRLWQTFYYRIKQFFRVWS